MYVDLLSMLGNTSGFRVNGKRFRMWATLFPPSIGFGNGTDGFDSCVIPPDDARTPFNETALFNASMRAWCPHKKMFMCAAQLN